ncbi:MAG: hypothetical protein IJ571_08490 [Ruminococcus sp.]|nr:hypothetical protein [Ruminococcus sp.]
MVCSSCGTNAADKETFCGLFMGLLTIALTIIAYNDFFHPGKFCGVYVL